jgi:hypothetical protein
MAAPDLTPPLDYERPKDNEKRREPDDPSDLNRVPSIDPTDIGEEPMKK